MARSERTSSSHVSITRVDELEIRPARPGDADVVADYHARCFTTTYVAQLRNGEIEQPGQDGMRRQFTDWFRPGSGVDTHVVVVNDVPIAHVTISGRRVVHLFVEPAHQRQGLGRRLLAMAESSLAEAGHTELELHTRVDNHEAIAFYERAGWVVTAQVIRTVELGISYDEHVLTKNLRERAVLDTP